MPNCVAVPNLVEIGQTAAEIWRFFDFSRWRPPPSWIFQISNGQTAQEGRTASPCQIWSKSAKTRPRYGDFSIFQDGGRRHLGFFKFQIFNGRTAEEVQSASPCQIWSKSVKTRRRYGDFSTFQDGGRRHLGFFKFQISNCRTARGRLICVALPSLVEIGENAAEIWRFFNFTRWRPPPSWIFQISNF